MTDPKGPVYLCFDVELQESRLPEDFQLPDLTHYRPPVPPCGNAEVIAQAAQALLDAEWPVLVVEGLGGRTGGAQALQSLVELLGLPVLEQGAAFNLANRHPLNLTGANAEVLKEADLILAVGIKDVEAALKRPVPDAGSVPAGLPRVSTGYGRRYESLVPAGARLMRIGLEDYGVKSWASSYGRLYPTALPSWGTTCRSCVSCGVCVPMPWTVGCSGVCKPGRRAPGSSTPPCTTASSRSFGAAGGSKSRPRRRA